MNKNNTFTVLCYGILKQTDSNIFYKHFIMIIIASNDIIVSNIAQTNVLNIKSILN